MTVNKVAHLLASKYSIGPDALTFKQDGKSLVEYGPHTLTQVASNFGEYHGCTDSEISSSGMRSYGESYLS